MGAGDPLDTQRHPVSPAADLVGVGFDNAEEIGRGGFGVVYRCTQAELDRTVAVKVLTVELDEQSRARFFREQRAMGRLTGHPNIVHILQVGATDRGLPFIVMPYHSQDSLDVRIRGQGALPLDEALQLGVKVAGAIETAHRQGILHRDVKPANILITDYGEPQLADFGIAHVAGGFETATGAITGSPAYTAPEVLAGKPPSPASDVYSLGATLFSALTGHAAFERRSGEQVVAQFLRITTQPVPDLTEHGIPDDVSAVISRAMSRTPDQRPATASDFGEQLRQLQRDHDILVDEMALHTTPDTQGSGRRGAPVGGGRRPSGASPTGNLPLELTSFVGRRHELTETRNLLAQSRLVTLTGIGGVGKTRLALRAAASVGREYANGVWLVELGELRDESLLVDAVAGALRIQHHSARPLREVLVEYIGTRELLLVLDNCEHIVGAAAELAETLLQACPGVRVLATSREPLVIGGEAVLRVPPLALPDPERPPSLRGLPAYDAVTLFAERAAVAVPGFALTDNNARAVAGICHRLDGLPLPIELAAARLRAMSTEQILQRLTDRYTLLTHGLRGAPTRQQTLRWCINWSYELCTAHDQLVWGRLSVFASSFELEAAEQVCGTDLTSEEILDAVTSLVDKSILIREEYESGVRFRLLETLRDYGNSKLEQTGEKTTLRRRHRDWYEALALEAEAEWISSHQLDWIARLKRELPNIRTALEFCVDDEDPDAGLSIAVALRPFWTSQGLYDEGRRWFRHLLAGYSGPPTPPQIKALYSASVMASMQGDLHAGAALVDEIHTLTADTSDPMRLAVVSYADGMLALYSGKPEDAYPHLETALAQVREHNERTPETSIPYPLGLSYALAGLTDKAVECLERAVETTEASGEKMYRSYSLWALGIAVWRQGDTERAVRHFDEALKLARTVHSPRLATTCLEALAWIAGEQRDAHRSAVLLGAAEELARSIGSPAIVHPNLLRYQDDCVNWTRQRLGNDTFTEAYRKGEHLSFDQAIAYALHEQTSGNASRAVETSTPLTKRERQVADLVAEGLTNQSIAARLVISPRTAQGHVEHILAKLGFTSRAQVAAWVIERRHDY
ncbi:protein kinase domain-containing protein [Rhodococcus wratislaviensis]|uniref:Putative serine/threonine protein kinase n=1 Tax=Rhodococcus wratislaviensis NBRC 100605 TaxID=1219028 RepID=X0PZG9_RHOWR|nr:protein kinase [Rhodococcus wratislaviensis]GAF49074.1 putative serine/threonine protein kinase [Rhodococcus wratislaviensis NBRC 100605]